MEIKVTTNAIDAKYYFDRLARSQLPFAVARSITRMAYDARDDEQSLIGYYFNVRTGWLTKKGAMPVIPARKSQWPAIYSVIAVADKVAALNATGGQRKPGIGGKIAVPLSKASGSRSARSILNPGTETLGPRFFPSRIVKSSGMRKPRAGSARGKPKPFIIKAKDGKEFVAQRGGDGKLQFLYTMKTKVDVPKRWPLIDHVNLFVARNYGAYLAKDMQRAIETMR